MLPNEGLTPSMTVVLHIWQAWARRDVKLTEIAAVITPGMKPNMAPAILSTRTSDTTKDSTRNSISPLLQTRKDPRGGRPHHKKVKGALSEDTKALI